MIQTVLYESNFFFMKTAALKMIFFLQAIVSFAIKAKTNKNFIKKKKKMKSNQILIKVQFYARVQ